MAAAMLYHSNERQRRMREHAESQMVGIINALDLDGVSIGIGSRVMNRGGMYYVRSIYNRYGDNEMMVHLSRTEDLIETSITSRLVSVIKYTKNEIEMKRKNPYYADLYEDEPINEKMKKWMVQLTYEPEKDEHRPSCFCCFIHCTMCESGMTRTEIMINELRMKLEKTDFSDELNVHDELFESYYLVFSTFDMGDIEERDEYIKENIHEFETLKKSVSRKCNTLLMKETEEGIVFLRSLGSTYYGNNNEMCNWGYSTNIWILL